MKTRSSGLKEQIGGRNCRYQLERSKEEKAVGQELANYGPWAEFDHAALFFSK